MQTDSGVDVSGYFTKNMEILFGKVKVVSALSIIYMIELLLLIISVK